MLTGGGAERVASLWIEGFLKQNHSVILIINTSNSKPITYPLSSKVKVFNVYEQSLFFRLRYKITRKLGLNPPPPPKLRDILHIEKPDLIIGLLNPYALWALESIGDLQIPIINTEHNTFERPSYAPMTRRAIEYKFTTNKKFNHVTVLTQRDYDIASSQIKNLSVLPNPLAFQPCTDIPSKEKIILVSARLEVWHCKGLDLIIDAFGKIAPQHPNWKLKIAGTSDEKSKKFLLQKAYHAHLDLNQIQFLGFCDDILSLYQQSEIFVLGSRYEGFGMSLIEAMSQGCACIACDYNGRQREIIENDSQGITCPIDDAEALANAMEKMISDDSYRKKCQKNAIERSKFYALPNIMGKWNDILKKMNLVK